MNVRIDEDPQIPQAVTRGVTLSRASPAWSSSSFISAIFSAVSDDTASEAKVCLTRLSSTAEVVKPHGDTGVGKLLQGFGHEGSSDVGWLGCDGRIPAAGLRAVDGLQTVPGNFL
jgi:hypothetical protein